ncbi:MAG: non-canonical purine NTP pyrophosphatase [Ardenticatenaceae bacterium]|nr:non-canonical purine NTP pyrophosphatase [Ardenticatenaceae bacterium]
MMAGDENQVIDNEPLAAVSSGSELSQGLAAVMAQEKRPLYFASYSSDKFDEYRFLVGSYADLKWFKLTIEEIKTLDFDVMVRRKIQLVKQYLPYSPFLVEQTGLIVHAWQKLPGPMTGQFMETVGTAGICQMMTTFSHREATAVTYLGYHSEDGVVDVFQGYIRGRIAHEPRGSDGYGWASIFIPDGSEQTYAEMSFEKRIDISTRTRATSQFYTAVFKEADVSELAKQRLRLRTLIYNSFNLSELKQLTFALGIDYEELGEGNKTEKIQELILYCDRHRLLPQLLTALRAERPRADWPVFA